jgi:hypothetical protein
MLCALQGEAILSHIRCAGCGGLGGTTFLRASHYLDEIRDAICALSRSDVLPVACPDLFCPIEIWKSGYPWIELPDLTREVVARNGFHPVDVSQFPPPGSIIRFDSDTEVTVTATDSSNQSRSCSVYVTVPPLAFCGTVEMNVPRGTSFQSGGEFKDIPDSIIISGVAYKMKGILQSRLQGKGSVTARLRKGGDKYHGSITFRGNRTKGALNNLAIAEPFSFVNSSRALRVDLQVWNNVNPGRNVARFDVYCQYTLKQSWTRSQ